MTLKQMWKYIILSVNLMSQQWLYSQMPYLALDKALAPCMLDYHLGSLFYISWSESLVYDIYLIFTFIFLLSITARKGKAQLME